MEGVRRVSCHKKEPGGQGRASLFKDKRFYHVITEPDVLGSGNGRLLMSRLREKRTVKTRLGSTNQPSLKHSWAGQPRP